MRSVLVVLAAAVLGLSSALLAACGDRSRLIPADDAAQLDASLQDAGDAVAEEQCARARSSLDQAMEDAEGLPNSVDPRLRRHLADGLEHAADRVREDCAPRKPTTTATTPTVTTDEPPPTTTEEPPPPPTQTQPPPEPPPDDGSGNGGTPPDGGGGGGDGGGGDGDGGGNQGGGGGNDNAGGDGFNSGGSRGGDG